MMYVIYMGFTDLFYGRLVEDANHALNQVQNFGKQINQNSRGTNFQDKKIVLLRIYNNIIATSVFPQDVLDKNSIFGIDFTA